MHYSDVIMGAMASQITSFTIVYSIVYSGADQRNIKASRHWPLCGQFTGDRRNPPHEWPVTRKMFPLDDVIMDAFMLLFLFQYTPLTTMSANCSKGVCIIIILWVVLCCWIVKKNNHLVAEGITYVVCTEQSAVH